MARITVEDCLEVVDNRFELVMMAARRARQLANGVEAQLDNSENDDKPTVLALREIAARRIDQPYIEAVDKSERERKERERWSGRLPKSSPTKTWPRATTDCPRRVHRTRIECPDDPAPAGSSRLRDSALKTRCRAPVTWFPKPDLARRLRG